MASLHVTVTVDMSLITPIVDRLADMLRTPALARHFEALRRDRGLVELQAPALGSGFTCRAVQSIQLLRLLDAYGVSERRA